MDDPTDDPKRIVERGYDAIADRHRAWALGVRTEERARYTAVLLNGIAPGAPVLELGCGAGGPTTQALARRFAFTGVDLSAQSLNQARATLPSATFLHADMTALTFPPASFAGVAAFYSIIHVPRDEQPGLLRSIASWLRPGGLLVASFGLHDTAASYEDDFLGAPMYWSSFDGETDRRMVREAGLEIAQATEEIADEDGAPITFLWIVARKPG